MLTGIPANGQSEEQFVPRKKSSYNTLSWRVEDGLPFGEVRDICQTRDGYLWLATLNGAVRFDGIRFETFDPQNTPELVNSFINCLFVDSSGRLWLGHLNGSISVWKDGHFQAIETSNLWPEKEVDCFLEDTSGDIWAVSLRGEVTKVNTTTPEKNFTLSLENRPYSIQKHGSRVVMQSVDGQIIEYRLHDMPSIQITEPPPPIPLVSFAGSDTNDYWMIHQTQLKRFHKGEWVEDLGLCTWQHMKQTILMEHSNGMLYVGTPHGLYIYARQGDYQLLTEENGLTNNRILCLFEDREGTLWVGTGVGITAIRPSRYKMQYRAEPLTTTPIMAITPKREGGLWIGTYGMGLLSFDQHTFNIHNTPFKVINTVLEASNGDVWFNCLNRFLARYTNGTTEEVNTLPRNGRQINVVFEGDAGALWAGGANGLFRKTPQTQWRKVFHPTTLTAPIRAIEEGPTNIFWFARVEGGLLRLDEGETDRIGRMEGLPDESVRTLLYDPEQEILWIGTSGGLAMLSGGCIASFTEKDGLPGNVISTILKDGIGRLWLQTNRGIVIVEKKQLMDMMEGKIDQLSPLLLDASDGFTLPSTGEHVRTGCRTADGHLWFVTTKGLIELDPNDIYQSREPVPLCFAQMQLNDRIIPLENGQAPKLTPGVYRCNISYSALSFKAPHRIRFKYRLLGYDDNWIDAGTRHRAEYHRLPPGQYRLELLACNSDGHWNSDPTVLAFAIPSFFWETNWFKCLIILLGILLSSGLGLAIADRIGRRRLIRSEMLRAVEQERSRISMDIHDEIGAGLTRVTLLSGLIERLGSKWNPPLALSQNLKEMKRESGKLVQALDEIVWMITPGNDTLQNLCAYLEKFAMDYFSKTDIRCNLDIPYLLPDWNMSGPIRHNLFLLVKEACNNIVKHAEATEVQLAISTDHAELSIKVQDNGKGLINDSDVRFSNGLKGMQRRMEQMGGSFHIKSNPNEGTCITLILDKRQIHL